MATLARPMPSQTFEHTARTEAELGEVWRALQRAETWAGIAGVDEVTDIRHDEAGHLLGYRFNASIGSVRYRGVAETVEARPPARMVLGIESAELSGSIRVDLGSGVSGTRVTVMLTARSKGFFASMAFPLIASAIGRGLPESVDDFAESLGPVS